MKCAPHFLTLSFVFCVTVAAAEPRLIGHWPLNADVADHSESKSGTENHGAAFTGQSARFDGIDDWIETKSAALQSLGDGDFTIGLHVLAESSIDDVPGDLLSLYDAKARRGFHLSLKTHEVTTSRSNFRTLHFGIDNDRLESQWSDHGRVGMALFVFGFAVHDGQLFVATCEPDAGQHGRVFRWEAPNRWIDCNIPAACNSVSALIVHDGKLYAGTAKYRVAGSALPESPNTEPGGRVFRYDDDGKWTDCGQLPNTEGIGGMTVFGGKLYAGSLYRPAGFFRYAGGQDWESLPTPNGKRVEAMCVYNGQLFASSYDEAHIFRYDGKQWADCGQVGEAANTQTYSFAVHNGQLYVGTWRTGKVFRYGGDQKWIDCGRLGEELEVMGMLVHNGRLLAGSLPLAGVFEYDGDTTWKNLGRVDLTPDVMYRRAWTMAEYRGRVFVGTLPSGRVLSTAAGVNVTYDYPFPTGWHHVAARRQGLQLSLFLDGKLVGTSDEFLPLNYDLSVQSPLRIGFGANDYFCGQLRDVRIYRGSLADEKIQEWASR